MDFWRDQERQAINALKTGAWWNGRTWRPATAHPRTRVEALNHRTALDRLGEVLEAIVGGSDAEQLEKARRFSQSANARRKRDSRKDDTQYAWDVLVARFGEQRLLQRPIHGDLLDDCVEELERGRLKTRKGESWVREGVKSFIRRQQRRL